MNEMLSAALKYAQYGWHIFPTHSIVDGKCTCGKDCGSPGKHPRLKNGLLDASKDEAVIRKWWGKWPNANIAVRTGPESGIWVLDVDLPTGPETLKKYQIPETMTQKTGSGGRHYFFQCNGDDIRNTTEKIGLKVDSRGLNGYVLLPPSVHVSGGRYEWLNKIKPKIAPKEIVDAVTKQPEPDPLPRSSYDPSAYGQAALANEIIKLSSVGKGSRNSTLNECAFSLSQLVAGGELYETTVKKSLLATALAIGLKESEARKTIESGFKAGTTKPRNGKNNETNAPNGTNTIYKNSRKLTETNAKLTETNANGRRFQGNLTASIREYIKEIQGSFTSADIDREFGITHPADKNVRRQALLVLVKEKYIKRDIRINGKYYALKSEIDFIDFDSTDASPFDISLPLDLDHMVRIPKKSLIVLAGSTNAGKTSIAIDVLRRNLGQPYQLMYLMSEMGPSEYKQRITSAIPDLKKWKAKVKAADVTGGFDTVVAQHNPNGLTVIDFLEEIQGEYYRIASDLRAIYDSLDEGVALVCLQKHTKADVGRGGESTAEKPRLYLSLDKLVHDRKSTISAIKIYKAKDYTGDNPNGLERHIVFERRGSDIRPISEWMYCNAVQRQKWVEHYEHRIMRGETVCGEDEPEGFCFYFTTKSGTSVRIIERDIVKWRNSFKNINVDAELLRLSKDSKERGFIEDRSYFHQISGILNRKNNERSPK